MSIPNVSTVQFPNCLILLVYSFQLFVPSRLFHDLFTQKSALFANTCSNQQDSRTHVMLGGLVSLLFARHTRLHRVSLFLRHVGINANNGYLKNNDSQSITTHDVYACAMPSGFQAVVNSFPTCQGQLYLLSFGVNLLYLQGVVARSDLRCASPMSYCHDVFYLSYVHNVHVYSTQTA